MARNVKFVIEHTGDNRQRDDITSTGKILVYKLPRSKVNI